MAGDVVNFARAQERRLDSARHHIPRHPLGDSMNLDMEELKRRRFKMHAEWTPVEQEASAEQFAMLKEFDRQFPAIVAKLEAAQRLRDALADCNDAWESLCPVNILAAFDKEQQ